MDDLDDVRWVCPYCELSLPTFEGIRDHVEDEHTQKEEE